MGEKSMGKNVVKCTSKKDGWKSIGEKSMGENFEENMGENFEESMGENFEESMGENITKSMREKRWVKKVWMKNSVKNMGVNVWMKIDRWKSMGGNVV